MKTIEELYNEVTASEEMKKEFLSLEPQSLKHTHSSLALPITPYL